ncbi:MAG: IPT/TIG domain-containing protein [Alphaproteobacteria bacterium]|nr:IPT/TIG domain-containing protein [Alphaproteobacteria bacterium]
MSGMVLALLMSTPTVFGQEVILRNDRDPGGDGTYNSSSAQILWAESPECIISVLTPEEADLPLEIHTIQILFGTSGLDPNEPSFLEGDDTVVEMGIQQLPSNQSTPDGRGDWIWGEEAFTVTITNSYLNDLLIDDIDAGFFPINLTNGKIAVWICAPDRDGGGPWPVERGETSGMLIHLDSPGTGNFIYSPQLGVVPLSYLSEGSFIIRAVAGEGSANPGDDTGDPNSGDDTGNPHVDGDFYLQSVTPNSAPQGEAVDVVILGDGFEPGTEVRIGGISLTGTDVVSAETILGRTPTALPAGLHDVEVILPDGESDYLAQAFEVTGGCGCSAHDGYSGRSLPLAAFALFGLLALRRRD